MVIILQTHVTAAFGVLVFYLLDLPLPWLLGPLSACLAAALCGVQLRGVATLNAAMRTIIGVAVGATFSAALLSSMAGMWATLLLIPVMVCVIGLIGVPYFRQVWGYDFPTSYYAAMPGGLQDMLIFGEEAGAKVRSLSLVHATRVLVIVAVLPFLLQGIWDADLSNAPGQPAVSLPPSQLGLMVVAGLGGWMIARWIGLFGASILGPLIVAGALAVAGILQHRPPAEAIWAAQFFIGVAVGQKYSGITLTELRRDVTAALGFCLILLLLTALFVQGIAALSDAPTMDILLAFAPSGQAEMTVLALISGADVAFVVAHHVLRVVVVIVGAPIAVRLFAPRPAGR